MGRFTDVVRSLVERYMPEDIERGMAMITAPGRMRMELHPARVPIH